jgi:hypothetical protein
MQIRSIERSFVRAMTTGLSEIVEKRLRAQSRILESQHFWQKNRLAVLLISLVRYVQLCVELIGARFRPVRQIDGVLFYENDQRSVDTRRRYLQWRNPGTQFVDLSYADKIASIPDRCFVWRVMPRLLFAILLSICYPPSQLTSALVRIVRVCLLTFSRACSSTSQTIYLFRIYRIETPFVAAFLQERGITVHLVASSSPLSFHNRILVGDSLKVCHPYQLDEFAHYRTLGACEHCDLWAPETFHELEPHYQDRLIEENPGIIGVYTQGFRLRDELGTLHPDFAVSAVRREDELLDVVTEYAENHPHVRFIVFPHPLERRHYKASGQYQFVRLADLSNVEIDFSTESNSTKQFNRVGLGLTVLSSIGFERIYLGFRTIFYVSDLEINWDIQSAYHQIFFTDRGTLLAAMDETRVMTHREFMIHYFGRVFYQNLRSGVWKA